MRIDYIELLNVIIAFALLIAIFRNRGNLTLLLALFVYGALHFGFAMIPLASDDYTSQLGALHIEGSGFIATLSALSILACVYGILSWRAFSGYRSCRIEERRTAQYIVITMVVVFCGYLLNLRTDDALQLKNVVSIEATLFLLMIGFISEKSAPSFAKTSMKHWCIAVLALLLVMVCIVIFEVWSKRSWAGTLESSGVMVYRASATLFNPNLLGYWASLVYLFFVYAIQEFKQNQKLILAGMILISILIYFTGSRSALMILLATLIFATILARGPFRWVSLLVMPITMISIYGVVTWLIIPRVSNTEGWAEISYLGARFALTPIYVINYFLALADVSFSLPTEITRYGVPSEIALSIEGRFEGSDRDAGWVVMYFDIGWTGLSAIFLLGLMALWRGISSYWATRNAFSIFALSALSYCFLIGFVVRFQMFPIWSFIAVFMTPCLIFWVGLKPER